MSGGGTNRRDGYRGYLFAVLAVALVGVTRYLLSGILDDTLRFLPFVAAITLSAWYGGFRAGILATLASMAGGVWIAMQPPPSFDPSRGRDLFGLVIFFAIGTIVSLLCENLLVTRRRLGVTLQSIGDGVIVTDSHGRVSSMNAVAERLTGWSQDEARRRPLVEVFHIVDETTRQSAPNPVLRALREGMISGLANHTVLIAKDGTETPIDDSAAPVRNDDGVVSGCVLVCRDGAVRRSAERSHALLAAVVESSDDAIVSKTLEGIITSWNGGAERIFGYTAAEAIGRPITMIVPPDRLEEERDILARLRRGEPVTHFETVRRTKDGRDLAMSVTISPIRDESGAIVGASKVGRDITERKRLERERREADRRKDEFLATLAHELRNPLAPIRNALQIIRRPGADRGAVETARDIMERQLEQMVRLIDDLLDVSRISRGLLELRREPVELDAIVSHAVEASRPLIETAGQLLTVDLPDEPVLLDADLQRLAQVFSNLLNNASKFTPAAGRISIEGRREDGRVAIAVRDTGVGIPPDKIGSIFDLFTQVDTPLERTQSGLGIGLTLVRRIVEMHGGTVEARSEGPGAGSEFVVRLPVVGDREPADHSVPVLADAAAAGRRRVLVVDDNKDGADSLAMLLKAAGHQVYTAHDGLEALASADRLHPDVMLLDIGLPKLNGYEVCRRIRREPWGAGIIVIALTGWGQEEDRKKSTEAGFDAHLVKPVRQEELMPLLARQADFSPGG